MTHVYPINDLKEHTLESTCECGPSVIREGEEFICIHNSYDGREGLELANELLNN